MFPRQSLLRRSHLIGEPETEAYKMYYSRSRNGRFKNRKQPARWVGTRRIGTAKDAVYVPPPTLDLQPRLLCRGRVCCRGAGGAGVPSAALRARHLGDVATGSRTADMCAPWTAVQDFQAVFVPVTLDLNAIHDRPEHIAKMGPRWHRAVIICSPVHVKHNALVATCTYRSWKEEWSPGCRGHTAKGDRPKGGDISDRGLRDGCMSIRSSCQCQQNIVLAELLDCESKMFSMPELKEVCLTIYISAGPREWR